MVDGMAAEITPEGLQRSLFCPGGSEAIRSALPAGAQLPEFPQVNAACNGADNETIASVLTRATTPPAVPDVFETGSPQ